MSADASQMFHFIAGLPRAGSTLLAALLRESQRFHACMTSPAGTLFNGMLAQFSAGGEIGATIEHARRRRLLQGLFANWCEALADMAAVFDTKRQWCDKSMLLVDYDLLSQAPDKSLRLIYQLIGEPWFEHDFEHVEYDAPDFDVGLGISRMHEMRPKIEVQARRTVLPPDLFEQYTDPSFWHDGAGSAAHVIRPKAITGD